MTLFLSNTLRCAAVLAMMVTQARQGPQTPKPKPPANTTATAAPGAERGKKLVLKDGTFQLAREYKRNGERVRYFSAERGDWEELPAAMIDWEATAKAEAADAKEAEALLKTVHHQEEEQPAGGDRPGNRNGAIESEGR